MMSRVSDAIRILQEAMADEGVNPVNGLPIDLFEFNTTLLPFVNVDLLITNDRNQLLLSWRNDKHYGAGWQIPGGIIRMMETIDERIQKTAVCEIGCKVIYDKNPIYVHENIMKDRREGLKNQLERAHNIAILYRCRVPEDYEINNGDKEESEEGFLRWFDKLPKNLLGCHKLDDMSVLKEWL